MKDLEIILENKPGQLALMGEILGKNNVSLEGGGVFQNGEVSIAHFLVSEPDKAKELLAKAGIKVVKINEIIVQKLRQNVPGQLGLFCRRLADADVNILVQYSDHDRQLIVVTDDFEKGKAVSEQWMQEWWPS
ncbi:amino acid-binding ACT domain-containing protein [Emticicia sp. CRIBPO]|uniref:amino acid-binding ACT domain-containing protein n=1 Tax=Emticicia sp. CRIBPO TaxID=2683258 RepID=UPI001412B554|nr:amino acid-binding ACT domain-containing protein [Emticicia sp. CRIBPO]NBA86483.1 amino acid-binding ACT domain-containing protein [Emticicia sp. CRIBPO]